MSPCCVWMRSTANTSPTSWLTVLSGVPHSASRFSLVRSPRSSNKRFVSICVENAWAIGAVNIQPDHVHLFLSAPPSIAPSRIAHTLKGTTARNVFRQFPEVKKHLRGAAFEEVLRLVVMPDDQGRYHLVEMGYLVG